MQMIKNRPLPLWALVAVSLAIGCTSSKQAGHSSGSMPSLRETFKNDFAIGTAMDEAQIEERDTVAARLIPQQFNAVTPENIMKAEVIHPEWNRYNFELADKLVAYAKKNDMIVNAHNLIWHSQLPAFVRRIKDADSVRQYFTNHIQTV